LVEGRFAIKINDALKPYGFESGNKPIGIITYAKDADYGSLNLENALPEYEKYCGVFETLGDKRLATHLLQGLEKIISFVEEEVKQISELNSDLKSKFPSE